jgi:hypothetical protein
MCLEKFNVMVGYKNILNEWWALQNCFAEYTI